MRVSQEEGGVRVGWGGRCFRSPMPPSALSARCGGKKRELERYCLLSTRSAPVQAEASQLSLVLSVRPRRWTVGQLIGAGAAGRTDGWRGGVLLFRGFGTQKGARQGDAMSRRKLGSRPQHLSAIQGKPGGKSVFYFSFFPLNIFFVKTNQYPACVLLWFKLTRLFVSNC